MSDTFIKIIQDVRTNLNGTVLGAKVGQVAGNLVEVKLFSLAASGGDRASLWRRLLIVVPGEPYKSLESYSIKDGYKFFGRNTEIVDVVRKILAKDRRLLVIYGRAGIGKTSLVDAGIAPLLTQKGARILELSNYSNPVETISHALKASEFDSNDEATSIDSEVGDVTKVDAVAAKAAPADQQMTDLAKLVGDVKIKPGTLFLVLDQFELFFQPSITKDRRQAFIKDLSELFNLLPGDAFKVIIVARDEPEIKAGMAELQKELPDLLESIVNVPLLNIDEAEDAINLPLELGGDRVLFASRDVVKELSLDLASLDADEAGVYPPHLQIVCRWLYEEAIKESPFHITIDLLNRGKRSAGIVARFLELRLDNQLSDAKSEALELLTQIASPGRMGWVSPDDLRLKDHPEPIRERVVELLEQMTKARLLYRHYVKGEVQYGFIDAGMANRVSMLAGPAIAEQHRVGKEMERMWQAWLARDVFATSEQLDYILKYGSSLELSPVRVLFLLRSAIERGEPTGHWLALLRTKETKALVLMLEDGTKVDKTKPPSPTDLQFASELLMVSTIDANDNHNGTDPRFKSISESAANGTRNSVRATAALTLMSVDVGAAVGQIDSALGSVDGWDRRLRRISLRSAMVEADPRMKDPNSDLRWFERLLIFVWILRAKAYRDTSRILRVMAYGAICSGLLVGAWGGMVAATIEDNASIDFSLRFTYGAFLGGFLALGLAVIRPLLLTHAVTGQFTGSAARAAFILCPIIFGGIHWLIHFFHGSGLSNWNRVFLISMGFLFGTGISLAMKNDLDSEGLIDSKWEARYILGAAIIFFLVHFIFIVLAESSDKTLHLNIVNSGKYFASHQVGLGRLIDALLVGGKTQSLLATGRVPQVYNFASALDATVTGILLVFGLKLGARLNMLSARTANSLFGR